jgi:glycosyltransferase involved in cell wall biosynthesis
MRPEISVVIPTSGRVEFLATAVRTALNQRGVSLEVIVVDDSSTDATKTWVRRRADPRLRLVVHGARQGVSVARNSGIRAGRGQWIAFLDDDDVWAGDKLVSQLTAAVGSGRQWAYTGDVHVDNQLRLLGGGPPLSPQAAVAALASYNTLASGGSSVLVRADLLATVGGFDAGLRRTEDWDMWLRLAANGPPACVARPLVAYRHHAGNADLDVRPMLGEPRILERRYGIKVDHAAMLRRAAWTCLLAGERAKAAGYYLRATSRGDLRSLGRAAVALTTPAAGSEEVFRLIKWTPAARRWAEPAEGWLAELRDRNRSPEPRAV